MISWVKGYVLYAIVCLIALLILGDIFLIYQNNRVITFNKNQQEQTEKVKISTSDVMRSLHLLDLAVRSYAFVKNQHFINAIEIAVRDKRISLNDLENSLLSQKYSMHKFYALRDSIESYVATAQHMIRLIDKEDRAAFVKFLERDPGYKVWLQYQNFLKDVYAFEDNIALKAKLQYDEALNNIYLLQVVLFFLAIPTLAYTAYYTNRTILISEKLRKSEEEKAKILEEQNQLLEWTVHERTREVTAQNEEITAQNEEIGLHNERLQEAKLTIERQNKFIQQKNEELATEVERQTQSLKQANAELIEHNSRLEQFAFIISHNLRAPMSRIMGLSSILDFTKDASEVSDIAKLMTKSSQDMDHIIKDLTEILGVQKMNVGVMNKIRLDDLLSKVMRTLEDDLKESQANISSDFSSAGSVIGISGYLESIFYNLISNAIKYKHPGRKPVISIQSQVEEEFVQIDIADNGLGINLETHKENLFNLYKRFHFHVDGRGLGLYLVKTQVTALGGKIDVRSTEGEGSVFTLWLKNVN
ncbi:MAG TPA: ATP-binding protein [Chryseolinea sp.]|jgi:signal transduction histidine kinase|nr:ATP-binding protein [Chryseolinea sp.]